MRPAGFQPAGDQAGDRFAVGALEGLESTPSASPPRGRSGGPPSCRGRADAGRSAHRCGPSGGRARPRRRRGSRAATGRCGHGRRTARPAPCARASVLATTIRPVVSLSSRCTMPGRRTPPMPERLSPQCAISAFTSVPVQFPAAGCTTRPAGLSMTIRCVVLVDDIERDRFAFRLGGLGRRHDDGEDLAGVHAIAGVARRAAVRRHLAVEDQRLQPRAREIGDARGEHAVEPLAGVAVEHRHALASLVIFVHE